MARRGRSVNGWLVLDKPAGLSSAQAVSRVRWLMEAAKAGHAGTLDPAASGILPIAFGEATKTTSYVLAGLKEYEFTVRWGEARDTDDSEGSVVGSSDVIPTRKAIESALPDFRGEIDQVPPDYSAIKIDGERAYAIARRVGVLNLASRRVRIESFELLEVGAREATFTLRCGKGTYVRALARDLASVLQTLGYVANLRRTRVGPFAECDAISLAKLGALVHSAALTTHLHPVKAALVDIPALALTDTQAEGLRHGRIVRVERIENGPVCAMAAGQPVALAEVADGEVRPVRVFNL